MNEIEEACLRVLKKEESVTEVIRDLTKKTDLRQQIFQCTSEVVRLFNRILETESKHLEDCLLRNFIRTQMNKRRDGEGEKRKVLEDCYRRIKEAASENNLRGQRCIVITEITLFAVVRWKSASQYYSVAN